MTVSAGDAKVGGVTALSLDLGRWMWWPGKLARQPQARALATEPESPPVRTG
jgi:hypothetical protein